MVFSDGVAHVPPFDDLYFLKRIIYSAQNFPRVLDLDLNRGVAGLFCQTPPLYVFCAGGLARLLAGTDPERITAFAIWIPPLAGALLAAFSAFLVSSLRGPLAGLVAGAGIAISPSLVQGSMLGQIDHQFLESGFALALAFTAGSLWKANSARTTVLTGVSFGLTLSVILFVQTSFLPAIGVALASISVLYFRKARALRAASLGFALAASLVWIYRLTRPQSQPDSAWFLGKVHGNALYAAALVCLTLAIAREMFPLAHPLTLLTAAYGAGTIFFLLAPGSGAVIQGASFFSGDPWLDQIEEMSPLFSSARRDFWGGIILMGGGAFFLPLVFVKGLKSRSPRVLILVSLAAFFFFAAVVRERFAYHAAAFAAICGALAAEEFRRRRRLVLAGISAAVTLIPFLPATLTMARHPAEVIPAYAVPAFRGAAFLRAHSSPSGRVLGEESWGHVINVAGQRGVLLDPFGSFSDEHLFEEAITLLLTNREDRLVKGCQELEIGYLFLTNPLFRAPRMASAIGLAAEPYMRGGQGTSDSPPRVTKFFQSTIWWRAYMEGGRAQPGRGAAGAPLTALRLIYSDPQPSWEGPPFQRPAVQIWEITARGPGGRLLP